jgi:predicted outer membrane repeat protein
MKTISLFNFSVINKAILILSMIVLFSNLLFATIVVDGYVYLDGQTNNQDIEVFLERTAPSSLSYTVYTDSGGYFSAEIESGIYTISYSFENYYTHTLTDEVLYSNTTIEEITLHTYILIPYTYQTIQEGISNCQEGDTVLVEPGVYTENINLWNNSIIVASLFIINQDYNHILTTIIDGNQNSSTINFQGSNDTTLFCGFTITNGLSTLGGGIKCQNSSPRLENLIISGNSAYEKGGGIYCNQSSAKLKNLLIKENSSMGDANNNQEGGGGIYFYNSSPVLENVSVIFNESANDGGGIYSCASSTIIINSNICNNTSGDWNGFGGGIYILSSQTIPFNIINSIISDNLEGGGVIAAGTGYNLSMTYSNCYNNEGGNFGGFDQWVGVNVTTNINGDSCDVYSNIQLDPLFVDPLNDNFHLLSGSPCIDAGDPSFPFDPDGTIIDMGAYFHLITDLRYNNANDKYNFDLSCFPNPSRDYIVINYSILKNSYVTIAIYNINGQIVKTIVNDRKDKGNYQLTYNINDLTPGNYFCKLTTNNSSVVQKIIIGY